MKLEMTATKNLRYATRQLKAGDGFVAPRRDARILAALGRAEYGTRVVEAVDLPKKAKAPADDGMKALREEYQRVVGKKPFGGWGVDELRERMAQQTNREAAL